MVIMPGTRTSPSTLSAVPTHESMLFQGHDGFVSLSPTMIEPTESKAVAWNIVTREAKRTFPHATFCVEEIDHQHSLKNDTQSLPALSANKSSLTWCLQKIHASSSSEHYGRSNEAQTRLPVQPVKAATQPHDQPCSGVGEDADKIFQSEKRSAEQFLQSAVDSQNWSRAVEIGDHLHLKMGGTLISSLDEGIKKCKEYFQHGLGAENSANNTFDPVKREVGLRQALGIYNDGCELIQQCHLTFDPAQSYVTGLDHRACTNLFTSAARICLRFSETSTSLTPSGSGCTPALLETNWEDQALEFLERGRSRYLLNAILHNTTAIPSKPRKLIKRALRFFQSPARHKGSVLPCVSLALPELQMWQQNMSKESRIKARKNWQKAIDAVLAIRCRDLGQHPVKTVIDSANLMVRAKAQQNWQKAIDAVWNNLGQQLQKYPVIDSALPNRSESMGEMRTKIPRDTVVVTFAQASESPQGFMVIVMTSKKIEKSTWQEYNIADLNCLIDRASRAMWPIGEMGVDTLTFDEGLKALDELSKLLLEPFIDYFRGRKHIIFLTTGNLSRIPWAMLPRSNSQHPPVVESYSITTAPSFSIWNKLRARHSTISPQSEMPIVTTVSNSSRKPDGKFRNDKIPYSRIEALHIARLHDKWPVLSDHEKRDDFRRLSKSSHIFHLCAHSTFEPDSPHLSRIELFEDSLRVIDFGSFQLRASLVVFSSCLSGLSRGLDSASALGFAHTILGTGAQAFVGTLWPVHDVATLLFMVSFYRSLRAGQSPAESLMTTQNIFRCMNTESFDDLNGELDYLLNGGKEMYEKYVHMLPWRLEEDIWTVELETFRHPRSWAGFVLIGYGDEPIYARQPKRRSTDKSDHPSKRPFLARGHTSV